MITIVIPKLVEEDKQLAKEIFKARTQVQNWGGSNFSNLKAETRQL